VRGVLLDGREQRRRHARASAVCVSQRSQPHRRLIAKRTRIVSAHT
jgi:hypothetical protein